MGISAKPKCLCLAEQSYLLYTIKNVSLHYKFWLEPTYDRKAQRLSLTGEKKPTKSLQEIYK